MDNPINDTKRKNDRCVGRISKTRKQTDLSPKELEDYEPGASRKEVLSALGKMARTPKS
jgi:hypothetical protein